MRRVFAFVIADYINLVLAALVDEIGRFVHVVPDASHAVVRIGAMQVAPPPPRLRQSVVNKDTFTGPDLRNE